MSVWFAPDAPGRSGTLWLWWYWTWFDRKADYGARTWVGSIIAGFRMARRMMAAEAIDDWDDDDFGDACSWCGGDGVQECDDSIQCTYPHYADDLEPCTACRGSGLAKDQVVW